MVETRLGGVPARSTSAILVFAAVALIVSAYVAFLLARGELGIESYKAFYCAGQVTLERGNPYLLEPLRACEHALYASPFFPAFAAEPAPLPTYAFSGLALLALLSPHLSYVAFVALLVVALLIVAWTLAKITGFSPALLLLVCLPMWVMSLGYGEITPFAVAAIALCGFALQQERPVLAAVAACAAMLEPHVALPVCAALFIGVARARIPLAIGAVVLALAGLVAAGFENSVAYFTTYLPAHAASEIIATDQYSLTHLLHVVGVGDGIALKMGSVSYVVMAALGIFAGLRLSRDLSTAAFAAFAPAAFVLLGGTFVHDTQMFAAMPLALTLLSRANHLRWVVALGTALLVPPWTQAGSRFIILCTILGCVALGWIFFTKAPARVARAIVLAGVLTTALLVVNRLPAISMAPIDYGGSALRADAPASVAWDELIRASPWWSIASPRSEGRKAPTWIALTLLVLASLRRQQPRST